MNSALYDIVKNHGELLKAQSAPALKDAWSKSTTRVLDQMPLSEIIIWYNQEIIASKADMKMNTNFASDMHFFKNLYVAYKEAIKREAQ